MRACDVDAFGVVSFLKVSQGIPAPIAAPFLLYGHGRGRASGGFAGGVRHQHFLSHALLHKHDAHDMI